MFEMKEVVFGTVIACNADNALSVQLDDGGIGVVAAEEISRREIKGSLNCRWMVGAHCGFFADGVDEGGRRILSGKAYENHLYEKIVRDFRDGVRNVYPARLASVTRDGKLAFYTIAQGVNASVNVTEFALTRVPDFNGITLPREMTVAIKEIDGQGRIRIYTKLAFGDHAYSVERLQLKVGSVVEGCVSGYIQTNGDSVVTLAPNLTVLARRAPIGSRVKVEISRLTPEEQRVKGEIVEVCSDRSGQFAFADWCVPAERYPAYVDIAEFDKRIGPCSRGNGGSPINQLNVGEAEISYEIPATVSPFAFREGETAVRVPLNGGSKHNIIFESQHGYLNEYHMLTAKAVNDMKYTTAWQVQRYLHLRHGLKVPDRTLWSIIKRLLKHDIIHALHFSFEGNTAVTNILYPGANLYKEYTGGQRFLPTWSYSAEPDAAQIKCCLSANQLMLGMLRSWSDVSGVEPRVYLMSESDSSLRIRPRFKLTTAAGDVYLESARGNWLDDMLGKLARYNAYFEGKGEKPRVAVTLEDEAGVEPFAQRVAELHLSFPVLVTCDLKCLPDPVMREVPAYVPTAHIPTVRERLADYLRDLFREMSA